MRPTLLEISNLHLTLPTTEGERFNALEGISLSLKKGERLGLVGESGSGKSTLARTILGLAPSSARVSAESRVRVRDVDVLTASASVLRKLRGESVALIVQNAEAALDPTVRVGKQIMDAAHAHARLSRSAARQKALAALSQTGLLPPERWFEAYPHHLSGGMCLRLVIALAFLHAPSLVIADEPTNGLDPLARKDILSYIRDSCDANDAALVCITHDLSVVSALTDRIAVMYAGRIVETGSAKNILENPAHPYARGMLFSLPSPARRKKILRTFPESSERTDSGCVFAHRCAFKTHLCEKTAPPLRNLNDAHAVACFHPQEQKKTL